MRRLGNRAVFATHLHDLAKRCTFINEQVKGESRIGSLVAGVEESDAEALSQDMMGGEPNGVERTYRIVAAPPAGQSFARDIARVHGISLEQITDTLSRRGVLEN
jgi:hypothetical protein